MQDFKKLVVWQKSYQLALAAMRMSEKFPKSQMYGLTSQTQRAAISVPANIAEGCGRHTSAELVRYLDIAMGSLSELHCYVMMAHDLNYIPDDGFNSMEELLVEVRRMLIAFI